MGLASVLLILVAQYNAWSAERTRYEAEVLRNARPDIKGEVKTVIVKKGSEEPSLPYTYHFFVAVSNHRPIETNLSHVKVDGLTVNPPMVLLSATIFAFASAKPLRPSEITLRYGMATELIITAQGSAPKEEMDFSNLEIWLEDGLGGKHKVTAKSGLKPILSDDEPASEAL
jgi:hypothetical protein